MTAPSPKSKNDPVLDYAGPFDPQTRKARHILALTYAAIAIPFGLFFLIVTGVRFTMAVRENTTYERRYERGVGFRYLGCSTLLLASGGWYARAGLQKK